MGHQISIAYKSAISPVTPYQVEKQWSRVCALNSRLIIFMIIFIHMNYLKIIIMFALIKNNIIIVMIITVYQHHSHQQYKCISKSRHDNQHVSTIKAIMIIMINSMYQHPNPIICINIQTPSWYVSTSKLHDMYQTS